MEDKFFNNMRCLVLGLLVALVGIGTAQEEDCLDGWTAYRGACFKLFTETMTMGSANNFCQSLGGSNVLRPKTKGIQALVQGMIMDHPEASYWMHMIRSPMIEGGWTYLDSTWLIDCDFTNWGPASDGEVSSNDGANTEQCAILTPDTNWQWEDTSCGNTYSYICQKGDVNGTSPSNCGSLLVNDPCPSGWTVGPGHYCYKVSATVATFAGAESVCAAEQARLAAPYDERTHQFIVGMGMLVNPNSDHWVGIKPDTVNGGFKFSDDTELPQCGYMKWAADQPDTSLPCGYLDSTAAFNWATADTSAEKYYICQKVPTNVPAYTCERGPTSCTADQFACPCNSCCLETAQLCDRVNDCTDGSDEAGCVYPTTEAPTTTTVVTTTTPAVTTVLTTTTTVGGGNIAESTAPDVRAPSTASTTTSRPEEGGSAAANTALVGAVAGGVVGAVVVVGAGAAVVGYMLYKKKQVTVEPTP